MKNSNTVPRWSHYDGLCCNYMEIIACKAIFDSNWNLIDQENYNDTGNDVNFHTRDFECYFYNEKIPFQVHMPLRYKAVHDETLQQGQRMFELAAFRKSKQNNISCVYSSENNQHSFLACIQYMNVFPGPNAIALAQQGKSGAIDYSMMGLKGKQAILAHKIAIYFLDHVKDRVKAKDPLYINTKPNKLMTVVTH